MQAHRHRIVLRIAPSGRITAIRVVHAVVLVIRHALPSRAWAWRRAWQRAWLGAGGWAGLGAGGWAGL